MKSKNEYLKKWRKEHPHKKTEKERFSNKLYRLKIKFTFEEYTNLLEKQNNLCAICNCKCPTGRALSIDHNHKTNKIRGLLCMKCNRAVGLFNDEPFLVQNAYNYLIKQS